MQKFWLISNLLIEAESDKISNGEDAKDGISDILITIASKLLQLKSFIVKDKKDGTNENDSENSSRPETSSSEGSSS